MAPTKKATPAPDQPPTRQRETLPAPSSGTVTKPRPETVDDAAPAAAEE